MGHYPTSTSNNFHEGILFEHATGLFVDETIEMMPEGKKAPRTVVRGPLKGGVWCNIQFKYEAERKSEPSLRSEGIIVRKHFLEHRIYFKNKIRRCYLIVTLRMPLDPTEKEKKFVKELKEHLKGFGGRIPGPQTAMPENLRQSF